MAREEDLQPAPTAAEKPKFGEFKIGDSVIYRQGTPGEATFTIKKAEIENGKFFYIMTAMRGAYPYRIAEDELILAPSTEEVKEEAKLEKEATEEIKRTQAVEAEVEEEELAEVVKENEGLIKTYEKELTKPTPTVPLEKPKEPQQPIKKVVEETPMTPPKPTKILSSEDMRLLQDYFNAQFFRALGKVPSGISSVFRVEFQEVRTLPFAEAKERILAAADDLIAQMQVSKTSVQRALKPVAPSRPAPAAIPSRGIREETSGGEEENQGGGYRLVGCRRVSFQVSPYAITCRFRVVPAVRSSLSFGMCSVIGCSSRAMTAQLIERNLRTTSRRHSF